MVVCCSFVFLVCFSILVRQHLGVGWLALLIYKEEFLQFFYWYCSSSVPITGFVHKWFLVELDLAGCLLLYRRCFFREDKTCLLIFTLLMYYLVSHFCRPSSSPTTNSSSGWNVSQHIPFTDWTGLLSLPF